MLFQIKASISHKIFNIFTEINEMLILALQAMSRYIALTATPKQPASAQSLRKSQQLSAPAQTRTSPQRGGKPAAQIEQEVQQIVQSVLGAAVASDLPLMQACLPFCPAVLRMVPGMAHD